MEEKVYFKNSKGDRLCGILLNPTGDKSKLIVILAHGFSSNKNTKNFVKLKDILVGKGISSFRFDFYGHDESDGLFENITITEAVDDILQAIDFLKEKGFNKIALFGSSFGGISSILAASKTNDLQFLALKSPVSDYKEVQYRLHSKEEIEDWKKNGLRIYEDDGRKMRLNYSFFKDFKYNNAYKAALKIKIPTLIVHGDADEEVPVSQSIKTSKIIQNCKLVLVKDSDHVYTKEEHAQQMLKALTEFIIQHNN
ncbi:hypothetical protein A3I50_04630 [Candidatus Roizmanbacteria bacterium RIFCSPLOWO2_02_FULL_37_9]|uniref:Peptidase S9 prolyl oligopeptidase catalytic domain-containing protein n=1 Tax=Candidatus Roizmanbacteria bacterium RIFCSPLOWO2_01_FULL_37_16 TaxID=1802058 RepID=A0A1F7IPH8_9BACT|nr:MAG: hypothetical protein A3F57_06335 [Candidatus Roizmanbacteria bacterium RIFCSPHIGHO2_12_FULL_36_11]OGK45278.1 MAG: hypothetical protein A3B40_05025 [Candidatus Roizmanbacteria bacterium RIFCSPLOWO2_01_FULL_37_16]OGK56728.1 MAG: hypothetical protein A3I50_04630 [Candidatus Roizmanbacteria bacterium RIFCSPLOWO2_02_FULL_37_9]